MGWLYSPTSCSPRNPHLSDAGPNGSRSLLHLHAAHSQPLSVRLTCPSYSQLNFGQRDIPAQTLNQGVILNSPPLIHLPGD